MKVVSNTITKTFRSYRCWCKKHSAVDVVTGNVRYSLRSLSTFRSIPLYIYKWKNHFSEMKGDVGMSLHEKEGEQEDA